MSDNIYIIDTNVIQEITLYKVKLKPKLCSETAKRFKIPTVYDISLTMEIDPLNDIWELKGTAEAAVQLKCVKSSQLFERTFTASFTVMLSYYDMDDTDLDVEILQSSQVDIGDIALQYLALEIPLSPVHPGIEEEISNSSLVGSEEKLFGWKEKLASIKQQT